MSNVAQPMRCAVIVSSRHRGWHEDTHKEWIARLITDRLEAYRGELTVTSIGCDTGFGKAVKTYCEEEGVKFFEFVVYFNGPRSRQEYAACYRARYASLLEVGHEYYFFTTKSGQTHLDELIERVRASGRPYYIFDKDYNLIEFKGLQDGPPPSFLENAAA